MTDPAAIAGILSRCLKINVSFKGGHFHARCDQDSLVTVLASASLKMALSCFDITIFKKSGDKFVIINNGMFIGNLYAVNNDDDDDDKLLQDTHDNE